MNAEHRNHNDMRALDVEVRIASECPPPVYQGFLTVMARSGIRWKPKYVVNMFRLDKTDRAFVLGFLKKHETGKIHRIAHFVMVETDDAYFYMKMMERPS